MGYFQGELDFADAMANLDKMPKQKQAVSSPSFGCAYVGGEGCGKSVTLCVSAICHAYTEPMGFSLIGRLNMPALEKTTMKTFLEMVPADWGTWGEQKKTWYWKNGHETIFRHLDISEPEVVGHIKSLNLSAAFVDEASEVNRKVLLLLVGRLRRKNVNRRIIRLASNPAGHDYMWEFFFDPGRKEELKKLYQGVNASSMENVFLPAEYLEIRKNTYPPDWADRFIHGHFSDFTDLVYKEFTEETHVWDDMRPQAAFGGRCSPPEEWPVVIGVDIGGGEEGDPWAISLISVAPNGYLYQFGEVYGSDLRIQPIAEAIWSQMDGRTVDGLAYDYAQRAAAIELEEYNLGGSPAVKEVKPGLQKMAQYLHIDPRGEHPFNPDLKGSPKLFFAKSCTNTIREFSSYKWAKDRSGNAKNEPSHESSHCPDSVRYAVHTFRPLPEKPKPKELWEIEGQSMLTKQFWMSEARKEETKDRAKAPNLLRFGRPNGLWKRPAALRMERPYR